MFALTIKELAAAQAATARHRIRGPARCRLHGRHPRLHPDDRSHLRLGAGRGRPGRGRLRPRPVRDRPRLRRTRPAPRRRARRHRRICRRRRPGGAANQRLRPAGRSRWSTRRRCHEEPCVRHELGSSRRPEPVQAGERSRSERRRRDRHRQGERRQGRLPARCRRHGAHEERSPTVHDRRYRHVRFRRLPRRGDGGALHRHDRRRAVGVARTGRRDRRHRRPRYVAGGHRCDRADMRSVRTSK